METYVNGESKATKRALAEDPQYFGAYLNMARHNIFLLINHLTETFNTLREFEKLKDDEKIWSENIEKNSTNILLNIFNPTKREYEDFRPRVYQYLLKRHFLPVLKIFSGENVKEEDGLQNPIDYQRMHRFLQTALRELNHLRNAYTHYVALDDNGNKEERKQDIDPLIQPDIQLLFKYAPEFSFIRNQQTQSPEDYQHLRENYKLFEDESSVFTEQGLFFFINLFLERSYATKFLKRFKGFKNETTPPFRATIQVFTSYALRVPDVRLDSEHPKQSLLMDMLNELNKCPKELYQHLTDADRQEFNPKLDENARANVVFNSTRYEELKDYEIEEALEEITVKIRHQDRFSYFALRFLDETEAFKSIRFQITLGKLRIKSYNKTINGFSQIREITKTINAFGRISDFLNKEEEVLSILKKGLPDGEMVTFEQYSPHYNINNNKIALQIFDESVKEKERVRYPSLYPGRNNCVEDVNQPSVFLSIHQLPKLVLLEKQTGEELILNFVQNTNPRFFDISLLDEIKSNTEYTPAELTRKLFDDTKKLRPEEANKREDYRQFLRDRRQVLQAALQQRELTLNQLPSRILDYLMNIKEKSPQKSIHYRIKTIKRECEKWIKEIESDETKVKLGELATFITRDMINMIIDEEQETEGMPELIVKPKFTPPYVNKLQNKIAFFSLNKEEIIAICEELHLFDKEKGHVFLTKELIQNSRGVIDFGLSYLRVKIRWLQSLEEPRQGYIINGKKVPLTFKKLQKSAAVKNFEQWARHKSAMPVNLPSSLFDDILNSSLRKKITSKRNGVQVGDTDKFSILLHKLMEKDTQPFYKYKRRYKINKEEQVFETGGLKSSTLKAKRGKYVEKNEKIIRFFQTKDRVVKILCDQLLEENAAIGLQSSFRLCDLHPASGANPLNMPARFEQKLNKDCAVVAEDTERQKKQVEKWQDLPQTVKEEWLSLKSKTEQNNWLEKQAPEEREIYLGQKGYQWTIKDFGRFKRFVTDRRIPDLSKYFENKDVPFDLLEYQIKDYDRVRELIFDLIFDLEKRIYEKDPMGLWELEKAEREKARAMGKPKEFHNIQFAIYRQWLKKRGIVYNDQLINWIRNRFSHSQFPFLNDISRITARQMKDFEHYKDRHEYRNFAGISIAKDILDQYKQETEKIINQISKA